MQKSVNNIVSKKFAMEAKKWIGTRFMHQGRTKQEGVDCLGLVLGVREKVLGDANLCIPEYQAARHRGAHAGLALDFLDDFLVPSTNKPRTGDVMLFELYKHRLFHLGVFLEPTRMLHADFRRGVEIINLDDYWRDHWIRTYSLRYK